jgi:hypothetical protein
MIKGSPAYTNFGSLTPNLAETKKFLKYTGQADWLEASALGQEDAKIWGEDKWDFSGRTDISDIKFVMSFKTSTKEIFKAYGELDSDHLEFGVRVWNKATRRRQWYKGDFSVNTSGNIVATFDSSLSLPITLANFSDKIDIQPLLVTKAKSLRDRSRKIDVPFGSIIGWSDPIVIDLDKAKTGLTSLFDIRWKSFEAEPHLEGSIFAVEWTEQPILFLNDDNQQMKQILLSTGTVGTVARARDAISSVIAQQVVTLGIEAALIEFIQRAQNLYDAPTEIMENLLPQNAAILRQWGWLLTQSADIERADDVAAHLLDEINNDVTASIIETFGIRIQKEFGMQKSINDLLSELSKGVVENEE